MKTTRSKAVIMALAVTGMVGMNALIGVHPAYADESMTEKAEATANDATRAVKKETHRAEEATCMQSDTKCLEEKAKHRAEEASDYTKDKAKETKNAVEDDDKN